jgi:hypothetical protein
MRALENPIGSGVVAIVRSQVRKSCPVPLRLCGQPHEAKP